MNPSRLLLLLVAFATPALAQQTTLLEGPPDRPMYADPSRRLRLPLPAYDVTTFMVQEVSVWRETLEPRVIDKSAANLVNPIELPAWPFAEVMARVEAQDGKAHGVGVFHYIHSTRKAGRATFRDGALHGVCIIKHDLPAGIGLTRTREVRCYERGVRSGPSAVWDRSGRMLSWGHYRDGKRHGRWLSFDPATQTVSAIDRYRLGERRTRTTWGANRMQTGAHTYLGKQHGDQLEWTRTGAVIRAFRNGEETGWRTYYARHGPRRQDLWVERGVPTGPRFDYDRWGATVASQHHERAGVMEGPWGYGEASEKARWYGMKSVHVATYERGALKSVLDGKDRKVLEVTLGPGAAQGQGRLWVYGDLDGAVTGTGAVNCHGVPVGEWTFVNSQGVRVAQGHYAPNPHLADRRSGRALPWVRIGSWTSWHPQGYLKSRRLHDAVTQQTTWEAWHLNGKLKVRGAFLRDKQTGEWETWYPDGVRESAGAYEHGKRTGRWRRWWPGGTRAWEGTYAQGRVQFGARAWDEQGQAVAATSDPFAKAVD